MLLAQIIYLVVQTSLVGGTNDSWKQQAGRTKWSLINFTKLELFGRLPVLEVLSFSLFLKASDNFSHFVPSWRGFYLLLFWCYHLYCFQKLLVILHILFPVDLPSIYYFPHNLITPILPASRQHNSQVIFVFTFFHIFPRFLLFCNFVFLCFLYLWFLYFCIFAVLITHPLCVKTV